MDVPDPTPSSPYPQSAVIPRHNPSTYRTVDAPLSAHPLTASPAGHPKKKHGPAVSAAWHSFGNSSGGKLPRGRPPSNRSVQDGLFSTFPANPQSNTTPARSVSTPIQFTTSDPESSAQNVPKDIDTPISATISQTPTTKKPSKLSLQVPQHLGGPVRLATPPPKVLVNGEAGGDVQQKSHRHERRGSADFLNSIDAELSEPEEDGDDDGGKVDWKRRALVLQRKLNEKEAELKALRRRVLDAVM